ncbi:MAG: proton-conducting membrane transporter [Schaedlerella sp.]|uniref:complex I subunit 5 family protein n=1 Tax=Schaedlerella sp. TaxID=2676057 RepID=UPI003527BB9C
MNFNIWLILAVFLPIACGVLILFFPGLKKRNLLLGVSFLSLAVSMLCALAVAAGGEAELHLLQFGGSLEVYFHVDPLGRVFAAVITVVWLMAGIFSCEYMKHEKEEKRYFGFYVLVYGVLMALCFSGNLVTYYMFYEMMTLTTLPLIMHNKSREAIMAGLKYLFYSLCGAYLVLFGIYFLNRYAGTLDFTAGGSGLEAAGGHSARLLAVVLLMILGFGVKAGMFPMHAWLPTAHPVAPAPASAVLSGLVVKMGVLGIVRVIFYVVGPEVIRGTWVQTAWLTLTLITVFMGSMLAYREKVMKKRLAYSTVSQISYILFGLALLNPEAMTGSLLHVVFHACIKSCLFLSAGAVIYKTGRTRVDELTGIGKEMPVTAWCYTFASLALVGIPPASGFISKWYLAGGSLESGIPVFSWLGPVILLVSALLTAGYLLPITIRGFLPGADYDYEGLQKKEPSGVMVVPLLILAGLSVLLGLFPNPLIQYLNQIIETLL